MFFASILPLTLLGAAPAPDPILAPASAGISGTIDTDTTWTAENSPYTVSGDITVAAGATLRIEPGVRVEFANGTGMTINGRVLAEGTEAEPIRFTRSPTGSTWERLLFVTSAPSRLRHCIIEFSDCIGDHKDYYPTDCGPPPVFGPRNYFQAVVAVACHLDLEECVFQNLPNDILPASATAERGDAIAIISDDQDFPGEASATIRKCSFTSIGQGVHTRYAFVVVENCFFTGHFGDNDDVDLYGESIPPSLIINNRMIDPRHDDMINPTRCSAILIGNVIAGSDDHGIVLRDKCCPVVINNLIYNCSSAGISVQNQCDAFLFNNTIVDCGRGIRFFDHFNRHEDPYCLFPGSGRATVVNYNIWDCPTPFELTDSPGGHSYANVIFNNVEGGQGSSSVSANSTLLWGEGNFELNPLFVDLSGDDFHLSSGSPCIDAGTNATATFSVTNLVGTVAVVTVTVTNDFGGMPRPLDGDGNGVTRFDLGAYEVLLESADSNGDGIPDGWTQRHGLNPAEEGVAEGNPDNDPSTTGEEWVADTDPTDGSSFFRVTAITNQPPARVYFQSSSNRVYTLLRSEGLEAAGRLSPVAGQIDVPGTGGMDGMSDGGGGGKRFYVISVRVP